MKILGTNSTLLSLICLLLLLSLEPTKSTSSESSSEESEDENEIRSERKPSNESTEIIPKGKGKEPAKKRKQEHSSASESSHKKKYLIVEDGEQPGTSTQTLTSTMKDKTKGISGEDLKKYYESKNENPMHHPRTPLHLDKYFYAKPLNNTEIKLTEEQKELIKRKLVERLDVSQFYPIYPQSLEDAKVKVMNLKEEMHPDVLFWNKKFENEQERKSYHLEQKAIEPILIVLHSICEQLITNLELDVSEIQSDNDMVAKIKEVYNVLSIIVENKKELTKILTSFHSVKSVANLEPINLSGRVSYLLIKLMRICKYIYHMLVLSLSDLQNIFIYSHFEISQEIRMELNEASEKFKTQFNYLEWSKVNLASRLNRIKKDYEMCANIQKEYQNKIRQIISFLLSIGAILEYENIKYYFKEKETLNLKQIEEINKNLIKIIYNAHIVKLGTKYVTIYVETLERFLSKKKAIASNLEKKLAKTVSEKQKQEITEYENHLTESHEYSRKIKKEQEEFEKMSLIAIIILTQLFESSKNIDNKIKFHAFI